MLAWLLLFQTAIGVSVAGPPSSAEYLPLRMAAADGSLARAGVPVSLRNVRSPADAAQDLGRGTVELAATTLDAALRLGAVGGRPPRLVVGMTAAPAVALLVPARLRDTVRRPGDLVGHRVGIPAPGSPEHGVLLSLLHAAGVPPGRVKIESRGDRGVAAGLVGGDLAAGVLGDPHATRLVEGGTAIAVVDLRPAGAAERWLGGPTVHAAIFVAPDSPLRVADLRAVARVLNQALARAASASAADLAAELPAEVVGRSDDFAMRLAGVRNLYLHDGRVDPTRLATSLARVQERWPIPVAVRLPRNPADLILGRDPG